MSGAGHRACLVWLVIALTLLLGLPTAVQADVLYDQSAGATTSAIPSQELLDDEASTSEAADDFWVPYGEHWQLTEVVALGSAGSTAARPFDVTIYEYGPSNERDLVFFERSLGSAGPGGWAVPLHGVPLLSRSQYWIAVQGVGFAADPWSWTTSAVQHEERAIWRNLGGGLAGGECRLWWTREICLPNSASQPDQAFQLIGTHKQILRTGSYGETGGVAISPPGVTCPPSCSPALDRGTVVTLTGFPTRPNMKFTGWRRGTLLPPAPGPFPPTDPTDLPCAPLGPCQFVMNEDIAISGTYRYTSSLRAGRLKRHPGDGSARLFLALDASGILTMTGSGLESVREQQIVKRSFRLPVVPKGWLKRRLRGTGKATTTLKIDFRPLDRSRATHLKRRVTLLRSPLR